MSIHPSASSGSNSNPPTEIISGVRYSLPELLAELKLERAAGSFAQEKLQQAEIAKVFHAQPKRRRVKHSA